MHPLDVIVLDVTYTVSTPEELAEVLRARVDGGNHFEIASPTALHPMLDVLVRGPYAVVHYFDGEGAGDQADGVVADPPDEVEFPFSSRGETLSMPGSVLIDVDTAVDCIEQFAETLSRPTAVGWIVL